LIKWGIITAFLLNMEEKAFVIGNIIERKPEEERIQWV